jgi:putative DNA primase/helicase
VRSPPSTTVNVFDAALAWYDAGACILPVAADGSKQPTVKWTEYQKQRPTREQVITWERHAQGLGMLCGAVSGGVEMFELEGQAVAEGLHIELRRMFEEAGYTELWAKLQTYVERSPKGGIHWIFVVEGGRVAGNTKLAKRPAPTPDDPHHVDTLIETRGEGGFTILAPSGGSTHESGKPWQLLSGQPGQLPVLTVDEVETLHRLARSFDEMPELPEPVRPAVPIERRTGELTPGDDYNQRTDWADLLVPAGWKHVATRGGVRHWRRPGKNEGISATTGYDSHGQGYDLLFVFTTSTTFQSERSYDKLGAYAVLHHGGTSRQRLKTFASGATGHHHRPAPTPSNWYAAPVPSLTQR